MNSTDKDAIINALDLYFRAGTDALATIAKLREYQTPKWLIDCIVQHANREPSNYRNEETK